MTTLATLAQVPIIETIGHGGGVMEMEAIDFRVSRRICHDMCEGWVQETKII
jgi:hypothetical protein